MKKFKKNQKKQQTCNKEIIKKKKFKTHIQNIKTLRHLRKKILIITNKKLEYFHKIC